MVWSDGETRTYAYDGSDSAISETLDAGFEYTITVHGANGGEGDDSYEPGGIGGFVEATYKSAASSTDIDIFVGEQGGTGGNDPGAGGWGRFNGGVGGGAGDAGGGGGGSTEVLLSSPSAYEDSYLAVADAGGGGGNSGDGGGGGGRCGNGIDGGVNGECPANVTGFGGDGSNDNTQGGSGGQAVANGAELVSESTGGSTHPDGTNNGYVEITASALHEMSGTVVEGSTSIQGATVEAINQADVSETFKTTTDSSGNWNIFVDSPGTYHVVARYEDAEGKKRTLSKPYISVS